MKDTNLYTSDWYRKMEKDKHEKNVKATIALLKNRNAEDLIPMIIGKEEDDYYYG